MKRIQDIIYETEEKLFVGRNQEIAIMEKKLLDNNTLGNGFIFMVLLALEKQVYSGHLFVKQGIISFFNLDQIGSLPNPDEFLHRLAHMLKLKGYTLHLEQDYITSMTEFLNELAVQKDTGLDL